MTAQALHKLGVRDIAARYRDGSLDAVRLTRTLVERIERGDPQIQAFVSQWSDEALRRAEALDRCGPRSDQPLWGAPLAHKDIFARPDRQPTCGAPAADRGDLPPSPAIAALEQSDCIDLGPINLAEFALGTTGTNALYGDVRNPWDLARCTGASSSGSAAAVAAGFVVGSLGTDTGASVRVPASFCGVVGLKPTAGAISGEGVFPLAWSLDSVGVVARSLEDCALLFDAVRDSTKARGPTAESPDPDRLTIGVPDRYYGDVTHPDVATAWEQARDVLERAGCRVIETPVIETTEIRSLIRLVMRTEAAAVHRELLMRRPGDYPLAVRKFISGGEGVLGVDYVDALRLRGRLLKRALETTFSKVDALLTPTAPVLPPRYDEIADAGRADVWRTVTLLAHCTQPASYLGLPALSAPFTLSSGGMPIGMQLIGAPWREATLFRAAHALERHWRFLDVWPGGAI